MHHSETDSRYGSDFGHNFVIENKIRNGGKKDRNVQRPNLKKTYDQNILSEQISRDLLRNEEWSGCQTF